MFLEYEGCTYEISKRSQGNFYENLFLLFLMTREEYKITRRES